ncbi:PKD domain-containing protein [Archangium lansingense]|uniref:Discoidin domain-containing protein n=1 Tax=Archangium lansingense TaxID=2995310 RepID=A0ABT4A335_9BACT|nr:discoidin domain-containing protein [Archangium lansinium]MCY1076031.1 discoidin domain-containing protein [Archangium lansinium]
MNKPFILLGSCVGALVLAGCGQAPGTGTEEASRSASLDTLVNVTLNKPATASHYQTDPYVFLPQYAVDGNITSDDSRWCTGEYITTQRYLDVDLQGTFDLHRMEVYTGYQGDRAISSFALQYHDGTSWQPIPGSTVTGNPATGVAVSRTFTQVVRGQKVRFLCNEPASSNCRVKELWVFGEPVTPGANQPPVANAGADQGLVLPTSSLTLTGSATDTDGTIAAYAWTQVSGPTATLSGASTATLSVSGLTAGTFVFSLTVTDDDGATHSDDVTVTVTSPTTTLTNVAKNKPATALSTNGTNVASRATDDNLSTFWDSGWMTRRGTHLDVDLQGTFLIHGVEVHSSFYVDSPQALANFDLLAWDGGCWKPIPGGSVRNNPASATQKTVTFTTPVVASKVRLLWLDTLRSGHVRELRVMGHATTPSTGPLTCAAGEQVAVQDARYSYALFLPAGYNADRDARWPIVFSLPGTGGVMLTDDHQAVSTNAQGVAWNLSDATFRAGFNAIAVSMHYWTNGPVQGENAYFSVSSLMALLGELKRDLRVDPDRVYFAGYSGGANILYGESGLPLYMDRVSAFVPIAVTSHPANTPNICNLRTLPIWPFHGGADTMGPASQSTALKTRLETQCGGTTSAMHATTTYAGVGHADTLWRNAFADPALWTWLFQQRISTRQP